MAKKKKTLLALDVATTTGWAFGEIGGKPTSGVKAFSPGAAVIPDDEVWLKATVWMVDMMKVMKPDRVAIEAPIMSAGAGGKSNPRTMMRLIGLQATLRMVVISYIPNPAILVHVQSARKFFIGHGNLPKEKAKRLVRRRCIDVGWTDEDNTSYDRTDALCAWAKGASEIDQGFAAEFTQLGAIEGAFARK